MANKEKIISNPYWEVLSTEDLRDFDLALILAYRFNARIGREGAKYLSLQKEARRAKAIELAEVLGRLDNMSTIEASLSRADYISNLALQEQDLNRGSVSNGSLVGAIELMPSRNVFTQPTQNASAEEDTLDRSRDDGRERGITIPS